jgi:hypothetical protein
MHTLRCSCTLHVPKDQTHQLFKVFDSCSIHAHDILLVAPIKKMYLCTEGFKSNIHAVALPARQVRATIAWLRGLHCTWRTAYANFTRTICVTYAPDSRRMRVTSANPTQMLRAPAARGPRNKWCYFWTPLYLVEVSYLLHARPGFVPSA